MLLYIVPLLLGVAGSLAKRDDVEVYDYQKLFGLDVNYKKDLCLDIVFVVDRSCSIPEDDLINEYRMIESAVQAIAGFGPDKTRVGLIAFDDDARLVIGLNDETTREGLLARIEELKKEEYNPGRCKTFTWEALKLARTHKDLFGGVGAEREKIIMLVTDGVPFQTEKNRVEVAEMTINEGALNDAYGIKTMIFTVKNKKGNLPPRQIFRKLVYDLRWMWEVEDELVEQFEARIFPQLARFTCPYTCDEPIDLIYVMDRSISITTPNIAKVKDFYQFITESFSIGDIRDKVDPKSSVAMLSYNEKVYEHFNGLDCSNATCVLHKIDTIPNAHKDFTVTNLALNRVKKIANMYTRLNVGGIRQVVILGTDGNTWPVGSLTIARPEVSIKVADELRQLGIDTVVVSVPNHRDNPGLTELKGIASHFMFDLQSEFKLISFDDLRPLTPTLVRLICEKYKPGV